MIWSIFKKNKEPHTLINELNSDNAEVSKNAYKELLEHPDEECDNLLLIALNSRNTIKEKKLAIISLLGHRAEESALSSFQKFLKGSDKDIIEAVLDALFEIGTPDCIDELVKYLSVEDEKIRQRIANHLSRLPRNDALGSLLRCVPENTNSELYFEIASIMEELNLFDVLKKSFSQPDPMIKNFYFKSIIKFTRPDFIPLYISFYPIATTSQKNSIIKHLKDYDFDELIKSFIEYISQYGMEDLSTLIDMAIISRAKESILGTIKFILQINDTKYKIKVLPNIFKHIDPFCYETVFELLKDSSYELRELAANSLIELIKRVNRRLKDPTELNKSMLSDFINNWEKEISAIMNARDDISEDYYKSARKVFFQFCNINHSLLKPFFLDFVTRDFFETYYLLKDWSFEEKYEIYSWLIKTEPAFGSILITSLNARADDNLWRLAIKLSTAFDDEDDSNVYRKNLITRYHNISIEKFLKDEDASIRAASVEIFAHMKASGYVEKLKSYAKDPSYEVRKAAIKSLLKDHSIDANQYLLELLDDPSPEVILYILKSLKTRIDAHKLSPHLFRFINSDSEELRNYVKNEIATITKEQYKANYNSMTPEMRKKAAQAIQKINNNFTDEIVNDLRSFDPQTRLRAALLLENIQVDDKGKNALISAMRDPSKEVRAAIVKTLGIVGDKEIVKSLISFFNDPDPRVRANTIEAISSLGDNTVTRILFPYLEDSNNRIRANAIVGICKFGNYNVTGLLQNMLNSRDDNMKASALWAIGEIGDQNYLPLTYPFMQDNNELIRFNSLKAISRINPQVLSPFMTVLRKDNSAKIRNLVKELSFKLI